MSMGLDVIILTFNEEVNLEHCIRSLEGLHCRTYIVDSGSTDNTVGVAQQAGAVVVFHQFENQARQFNWALENLPLAGSWVLRLDADEYLLPELRDEIRDLLKGNRHGDVHGYYLRRRMIFMGRWIRHGGYYPVWLLRLFRRGSACSEDAEMDEHIVLSKGVSARLTCDFVDHNRKGLSDWTIKHERYASRQARVIIAGLSSRTGGLQARLFGNQAERKRWLKHTIYGKAPPFFRSFAYFIYRFIGRGGFLDGLEGFIFHYLHTIWYAFYVDAKIIDMRRAGGGSGGGKPHGPST